MTLQGEYDIVIGREEDLNFKDVNLIDLSEDISAKA
jgi:hypothetical protein